jgi:hypothetical protein
MTTTSVSNDPVSTATFEARVPPPETLADRFYDLLALPTDALDREMTRVLEAEHELPDPLRYEATLSRLRAWLALDSEDARILAASCDRAIATLPPEYRWRRIESERAVLMNALSYAEFRRLADFLPWLDQEVLALAGGAR